MIPGLVLRLLLWLCCVRQARPCYCLLAARAWIALCAWRRLCRLQLPTFAASSLFLGLKADDLSHAEPLQLGVVGQERSW